MYLALRTRSRMSSYCHYGGSFFRGGVLKLEMDVVFRVMGFISA